MREVFLWETAGTGTLVNETSETVTYTPSNLDKLNKSVLLIINSTDNGICDTAQATVSLDFAPLPDVNAGFDYDICANATSISLEGSFTVSDNATWATYNGNGSFSSYGIGASMSTHLGWSICLWKKVENFENNPGALYG